jgi:GNAT superfamily N-acetyltransferase
MTPGDDHLRAIFHTVLLATSPLDRYHPGPIRRSSHGAVTLTTDGDAGPDFNHAVVLGPASPDQVFAVADPFFGDPAGYSVVVEAGAAPAVEEALRGRGWRLDEEEPALVLSPLPPTVPPAPWEIIIRQVADEAGFADFLQVSGTPSRFLPSVTAALDPAVALWVGYVGGLPVATSRLTCLGTVADLNGVAVVPEQRRRGYGTALTWAAVEAARAMGCAAAVLTATELGYPIYVGMGFRPVGIYRTYLPPQEGSNGWGSRVGNGE